jgi:YVTN family beta-propeller protein
MNTLGIRYSSWAAVLLSSALSLMGCSKEESKSEETCLGSQLSAQPSQRFPTGSTFYLPTVEKSSSCSGSSWALSQQPEQSSASLVTGADGYTRVTPLVPGTYNFTLSGTNIQRTLQVIDAKDVPFEHFNYYPLNSVAVIEKEVWVAHTYNPEISIVDPNTNQVRQTIPVGPWPVALAWNSTMNEVLVAHKGGDTLGFVDKNSKKLVDSVWVGDEPSNVVVSADGKTAYVALATEAAIAVVDIPNRRVVQRIATVVDPLAMALDSEHSLLYVTRHRSAQPKRFPFADRPAEDLVDGMVIDTNLAKVVGNLPEIGSTISAMLLSENGEKLYISTTKSVPEKSLAEADGESFHHNVVIFDTKQGAVTLEADLSHQPSSKGYAVTTHGLSLSGGLLWVVLEGSDSTVGLDPLTLEEKTRVVTPGRPRSIASDGDSVWVHGAQSYALTKIKELGKSTESIQLSGDPRPAEVTLGQSYFTGAGEGYGINRSCNSCHLDGIMDGNVWKAGPFDLWSVSKPFFWLEGTAPLGWEGYLSDEKNFAVTVGSTIEKNPNNDEAHGLASYLRSLVPPPAANGHTERDGTMTTQALRGKTLFESDAKCNLCHNGPLRTDKKLLKEGITEGLADVPSLIGSYRYNFWFREGQAHDLRSAVKDMATWQSATLSDNDLDDVTSYVQQLGTQEFFLLTSEPLAKADAVAIEDPITLTFSHALFNDSSNLRHVHLQNKEGVDVPSEISAANRYLTVKPQQALQPGSEYRVIVDAGFESFGEKKTSEAITIGFKTALPPKLRLEGDYTWKVQFPGFDMANKKLDPNNPSEVSVTVQATPTTSGAKLTLVMTPTLNIERSLVIDGTKLNFPALPLPLGGTAFANMWSSTADLVDSDGDGIADSASGTVLTSGPGFRQDGVAWSLEKTIAGACTEEMMGKHEIELEVENKLPIVSWKDKDVTALGYYVTESQAKVPLGPGMVTEGTSFWVVQSAMFPKGFQGPVSYGVVPEGGEDKSEANGATKGGDPLPSPGCVKFTVIFSDFSVSSVVKKWE